MNIQENGDEDVPAHEVDLDGDTDRSASYAVVRSIAELTGREPDDLESLWDSVDPEALDSFVAHAAESSTRYRLSFQYQGYTVEVENRRLRFTPTEGPPSSAGAQPVDP